MLAGMTKRAVFFWAAVPMLMLASPARAAYTVDPNGSIMLRGNDPAIIYLDHGDFTAGGGEAQFSAQIARYNWSERLPSSSHLEAVRREELATSSCMNKCGESGHCAVLGTYPPFSAEQLFGVLDGSYRYSPYTMGCPVPSRAALAAFEHAWNFGGAMDLCPSDADLRSDHMCSLLTSDVFAILLLAREAGYDQNLVNAIIHARSLIPLEAYIEFGEASAAVRKAGEAAVSGNAPLRNPDIYSSLIGGIFEPVENPPEPYTPNCLENSKIFTTSAWRILQPRFALLRQPLMNRARDAFEERPRQPAVGFPGGGANVGGNAGGAVQQGQVIRERATGGCFRSRTNEQEYTDWELVELIILSDREPVLKTALNKLIAAIEAEDRALYVKAQKIAREFVWTDREIAEAEMGLIEAEIRHPEGGTASNWMIRFSTIDPMDTYDPNRMGSANIPMPEKLAKLRDELERTLQDCGGP